MHRNATLLLSLAAALLLAATLPSGAAEPAWGYHGEIGPEHWGELDPAWAICDSGREQSPIDLETDGDYAHCSPPSLSFTYGQHVLDLLHTGEGIRATPRGTASRITLAGQRYNLAQFHWHTPSEHSVDGSRTPLEMHFVHTNSLNQLAVVGVMIRQGRYNAAMDRIFSRLPAAPGLTTTVPATSLLSLLPSNRSRRWSYPGSLTTPDCRQGVRWTVLATPIEMSAAQIAAFTRLFSGAEFPEGNTRPIQELFGRPVCTAGIGG